MDERMMNSRERSTRRSRGRPGSHSAGRSVGRTWRRSTLQVASLWFAAAALSLSAAGRGVEAAAPYRATSNREARADSLRSIPLDKLSEDARAKVWQVVSSPSVFRRMPVQAIDCDPDLYVFLVRHPDVVVNIWQLMGITKAQVKRTGAYTFDASDGSGTVTSVELVYGSPELHVMYAEGAYEGPLLKQRVEGKCVLVLRTGYFRQADDRVLVTHRLDVFLQLPHAGAELLAKTLHPLVGRLADHNFAESSKFLGLVSAAAKRNGPGMEQLAGRLTRVAPDVRARFAKLTAAANHEAVLQAARPASFRTQDHESVAAVLRLESAEGGGDVEPPDFYYLAQAPRRSGPKLRR
jgi:hypothetical protein